ncbi:hypothetical protein PYCCODRAFT_1421333 [Trametes coccinea BRFM310]|uniref:Uncharacterized protein n=1 Tax=Trametes coccinea (strain BRFM310) TaxID=1353009 RepID=A0A1Y2J6I3_TRAC3|nr:hypothetical protein PYCCODRAFT_1421333 [Trametes coccinea BRFM310]
MQSPSEATYYACQYNSSRSFQPFTYSCERQFPIYAHCNSQRKRKTPALRCNTTFSAASRQQDLMQTVDYRHHKTERQPRSSFALSDIFETDEEDIQIEISPVLPSTPNTASSVSTSRSRKARMKAILTGAVYSVKATWNRARPARK